MLYDISPIVSNDSAVYPGDQAYTRQVSCDMARGDPYTLSSIHTTLHAGAHADAPAHYAADGQSIEQRALSYYLGPCQVISAHASHFRIQPEAISTIPLQAPRILFKTNTFTDPNAWHDNFAALSPELIDYLAEHGVKLVGIDTPSVDPAQEKSLSSHHRLHHHDMAVLENLILSAVPDGLYTLIALPLKLQGAEAAPVRAVLSTDVLEIN